jgi:hypothetical protein
VPLDDQRDGLRGVVTVVRRHRDLARQQARARAVAQGDARMLGRPIEKKPKRRPWGGRGPVAYPIDRDLDRVGRRTHHARRGDDRNAGHYRREDLRLHEGDKRRKHAFTLRQQHENKRLLTFLGTKAPRSGDPQAYEPQSPRFATHSCETIMGKNGRPDVRGRARVVRVAERRPGQSGERG